MGREEDSVSDLIAKIGAAIDEDERRAKWAATVIEGRWDSWEVVAQQLFACCDTVIRIDRVGQHLMHTADPARVLRQAAAHRKILEVHAFFTKTGHCSFYSVQIGIDRTQCWHCPACGGRDWDIDGDNKPCPTILALAESYGIEQREADV